MPLTNPLGMVWSDPAGKDDVVTPNDISAPFGRAAGRVCHVARLVIRMDRVRRQSDERKG